MKKIKLLLIALILTLTLAGCSFSGNSNSTSSTTESTEATEYKLEGNLEEVIDFNTLKTIFDTKGIVIFYSPYGSIDKALLEQLKSLGNEYNTKVYCVKSSNFNKNSTDTNIQYVLSKISSGITNYNGDGSVTTPDFYEIKDGKIVNRVFGISTQMDFDNPTDDNKKQLKELYRSYFTDLNK